MDFSTCSYKVVVEPLTSAQMRSVTENVCCSAIKASNIELGSTERLFTKLYLHHFFITVIRKFITNPELPKKSKLCSL